MNIRPFIHMISVVSLIGLSGCVTPESRYSPQDFKRYSDVAGKQFSFGPIFSSARNPRYSSWYDRPDSDPRHNLPYDEYVGRRGKLTEEKTKPAFGSSFAFQKAILENGEVVYANINITDPKYFYVYFDEEVENAKKLIGKTVWINLAGSKAPSQLITSNVSVSFPLYNIEPVTVINYALESYGHSKGIGPFYLRLRKSSGDEGLFRYNETCFFTFDPIPKDTSAEIREAIQRKRIIIGMDKRQAVLAWGDPKTKNHSVGPWGTHEQWVYGNQYLYFENGFLKSFQSSN